VETIIQTTVRGINRTTVPKVRISSISRLPYTMGRKGNNPSSITSVVLHGRETRTEQITISIQKKDTNGIAVVVVIVVAAAQDEISREKRGEEAGATADTEVGRVGVALEVMTRRKTNDVRRKTTNTGAETRHREDSEATAIEALKNERSTIAIVSTQTKMKGGAIENTAVVSVSTLTKITRGVIENTAAIIARVTITIVAEVMKDRDRGHKSIVLIL